MMDDFIKAKKFIGEKADMVFKFGEQGIGYYRDGPTKPGIEETLGVAPFAFAQPRHWYTTLETSYDV